MTNETEAIQREIVALREKASALVEQLTMRAREAFDVPARLRAYRRPIAGAGIALAAGVAGLLVWKVYQARRSRRLSVRVGRKLGALRELYAHAEDIAAQQRRRRPELGKLLEAALVAFIATAGRVVARKLIEARR